MTDCTNFATTKSAATTPSKGFAGPGAVVLYRAREYVHIGTTSPLTLHTPVPLFALAI